MASQKARLYHLGASAPKRSTLADANRRAACRGVLPAVRDAARPSPSGSAQSLARRGPPDRRHQRRPDGAVAELGRLRAPAAAVPSCTSCSIPPRRCPCTSWSRRRGSTTSPSAKVMPIEAGATYVFDLGYYDFSWWATLDALGCRFVTRLKSHTRPTLIEERRVEAGGSIIADRVIRLAGRLAGNRRNPLDRPLREVHVKIDTGKILRLVSNDLQAPAAGDRRALQDALADRAVLSLGQADPQNPPLPRHLPQRRPNPDRRRPDRLSAAAHGPRRAANGRKHPHLRSPGARQPHALPTHPSISPIRHQDQKAFRASWICIYAEPDSSDKSPG